MTRPRYRRNVATVAVPWTYRETDELCEVECEVSGGEKEIRWGDNACPGSPPDVEIIAVHGPDGRTRDDLLDAAEEDKDLIESAVFETLADDDCDDEYDRRRGR